MLVYASSVEFSDANLVLPRLQLAPCRRIWYCIVRSTHLQVVHTPPLPRCVFKGSARFFRTHVFAAVFRAQVHPRLPPNLLRASDVLVVEAPSGVRANVLRFLKGIPKERISKRPVERSR